MTAGFRQVLPEQPMVEVTTTDPAWRSHAPQPYMRPARAGDTITVPCPDCNGRGRRNVYNETPPEDTRQAAMIVVCGCGGSGSVRVTLTADPAELEGGWLIEGTTVL